MYSPRKKVFWFAIISRITILLLQLISNVSIPDHQADAFKRPLNFAEKVSRWDQIVHFLFSGLTRWDGEYFLHIAREGYTYENTFAFYPLYPLIIRIVAIILKIMIPEFFLNGESTLIIAAMLINFVCFVQAAVTLYDLTEYVFLNTVIAYKAAILYCINPASIFFSAVYSESMFAYLTFYTMLASMKCVSTIYISLILSVGVRSNGIINLGFPMYFGLKDSASKQINNYRPNNNVLSILWHILKLITLKNFVMILIAIITSLFQFALIQIYNYTKFCTATFNKSSLPEYVLQYATENNLVLTDSTHSTWCNDSLPLAYPYVQKTYWNIGFFKYYQFKQKPNFILAFPILYMLRCIKEFACEYKNKFYLLGLFENNKTSESKIKKYPLNMFSFVVHGLFLTLFWLFFVHINQHTFTSFCKSFDILVLCFDYVS